MPWDDAREMLCDVLERNMGQWAGEDPELRHSYEEGLADLRE